MSSHKKNYWTIRKIPKDEYVTLPIITAYELAKLIATTADYIIKTRGNIHMDISELYISTDDIPAEEKAEVKPDDIYIQNGRSYIKLKETESIAKLMINKRVAPFKIMREIGRNDQEKIIEVEEWNVNDMIIPLLDLC
jgi:hypothetical protein